MLQMQSNDDYFPNLKISNFLTLWDLLWAGTYVRYPEPPAPEELLLKNGANDFVWDLYKHNGGELQFKFPLLSDLIMLTKALCLFIPIEFSSSNASGKATE